MALEPEVLQGDAAAPTVGIVATRFMSGATRISVAGMKHEREVGAHNEITADTSFENQASKGISVCY